MQPTVTRSPSEMSDTRVLRWAAALLSVALLAAACSTPDSEDTTAPPTPAPGSTTTTTGVSVVAGPVMTMDEALGGMQAVQDFAVYTGVWAETDDGIVPLYDEIVEHATGGAGPTVALQGGFTFVATDALEAKVVDAIGALLPSLRADFGLMDVTADVLQYDRARLVEAFKPAGRADLVDGLFSDPPGDGAMIVEIVTADYDVARTHAGPGDRVVLDLGFVSGATADDTIGVSYMFGQTLPGDPAAEAGLSPSQLFEYRWNEGLVRMLADGDGRPSLGVSIMPASPSSPDASTGIVVASASRDSIVASAAARSTRRHADQVRPLGLARATDEPDEPETDEASPELTRLAKELILATVIGNEFSSAEENFWQDTEKLIAEFGQADRDWLYGRRSVGGTIELIDLENRRVLYVTREAGRNVSLYKCAYTKLSCMLDPDDIIGVTGLGNLLREYAMVRALQKCSDFAAALNKRNEASASPTEVDDGPPAVDGDGTADDGDTEGDDDDTADDSADGTDAPPPVSCPPPPDTSSKPPTGSIHGDVHLRTIDGNVYAHQAPGEFLAFDNGVASIQVRTERWVGSDWVTVATAVAARVDDHTVSIHAGGEIWIDGALADIGRGETVHLGAGEVLRWEKGSVILWPDGTVAKVQLSTTQLLIVRPPSGTARGLLGDFDGDPTNDLVTRDGEQLDADADQRDWERFYERYIDSWRITQDESLFHYADGESTDTFQRIGPPPQRSSVDLLPAALAADAEAVCRSAGITREEVLEACILDVGVTGERAFAYDAYLVQASTPDPDDLLPPVVTGGGGGDTVLTIGDQSLIFGLDPPTQNPDAPSAKWECQVDDGSFFADASFRETTASYELRVEYLDAAMSNTGTERFSIVVRRANTDYAWVLTYAEHFAAAVDEISLDGATLTASGVLYVNDPPALGMGPISALPPGSTLTPFTLTASCDQ
jgi:hypothetical protein